jgi:hypothetical protein
MKKIKVGILAVMFLLVITLAPVSVVGPPHRTPLDRLEGHRITLWGRTYFAFPAVDAAYVAHGWDSSALYEGKPHWPDLSGTERAEFLSTSTFELYIDDEPVDLTRAQWYDNVERDMIIMYYVQFEPSHFKPGTYEFRGEWYTEVYGVPRTRTLYLNVHVTAEQNIFESSVDPEPYSGHTRCDAIYAGGLYWLFFDWVSDEKESGDSDVFAMSSSDGLTWGEPVAIAESTLAEHSVKTFCSDDTLYVTYQMAGWLYYMYLIDENEMRFSVPRPFYRELGGGIHGPDHDMVFGDGLFYLAYMQGDDIVLATTNDIGDGTWSGPTPAAATPGVIDFSPELCWAREKLWLFWDHPEVPMTRSYAYVMSYDGKAWSDPVLIPHEDPEQSQWGPFSVFYDEIEDQFVFVTRTTYYEIPYEPDDWLSWKWRIVYSTSQDENGEIWTQFRPVTHTTLDKEYAEKGPTVFRLHNGGNGYRYSVIFKRLWFDGPYQLCQVY